MPRQNRLIFKLNFSKMLLRNHNSNSGPFPPIEQQPKPIPLADSEAQKEFEELQRQFEIVTQSLADRGEANSSADYINPDINETGKNIKTGEINGPKGKEPTRFGDWEKKGRVSDF